MRFIATLIFAFFALAFFNFANAAGSNANILSLNTATTNVTTSAYVQLSASTPVPTAKIVIQNETSSAIIVAFGAASSEVGFVAVGPTSTIEVSLEVLLPKGTRVSVEAVDATASTKFISVSLIP